MTFRVGQRVECVDARGQETFLAKGAVYAVESISPCRQFLRVGATRNGCGHFASRFRPLIDRETDISFAHEILRKASKKAPSKQPAFT